MSVAKTSLSTNSVRPISRQNERRLLVGTLVIVDIIALCLSFLAAYLVRFVVAESVFDTSARGAEYYLYLSAFCIVIYLSLFTIHGLYNPANLLGGTREYERLFNAVTTGAMLIVFLSFFDTRFDVARAWLVLSWGLSIVIGSTARFTARRAVYQLRRSGHFLDRTLIVGANPEGLAVTQQLVQAPSSGAKIIGFIDDYLSIGSEPLPGIPVIGNSVAFASLVRQYQIDSVVIANTAITRERLLSVYSALDALNGVEVRLASGLFELLTTGVQVREEGYVPLVTLNKTRITGVNHLCKTLLDYVVALAALIGLSPLLLVIAFLVWRDSPGPVIHRRRVVGVGKNEFDAFKFRTMYVNGNDLLTPEQRAELAAEGKLKDDPRITRIGGVLRKYSLDELPQLINVLMGQMSLIGPRMITAPELEKFGKWQHNLMTVKPGLTGLWQISGRSDLSYEDRVRLDMHYIRNYSIWLDLRILVQTIPALLSHRGAY